MHMDVLQTLPCMIMPWCMGGLWRHTISSHHCHARVHVCVCVCVCVYKSQCRHNTVFSWICMYWLVFNLKYCSLDTAWYAHHWPWHASVSDTTWSPVKSKLSTTKLSKLPFTLIDSSQWSVLQAIDANFNLEKYQEQTHQFFTALGMPLEFQLSWPSNMHQWHGTHQCTTQLQ